MDLCWFYSKLGLLVLLCASTRCQESSTFKSAKTIARKPRLTRNLDIDENHKAWVFDSLFSKQYNEILSSYLTTPYANESIKNLLRNYTYSPGENSHTMPIANRWIKYFDEGKFQSFKLWKTAKPLIEEALKTAIYLENVHADYVRSLDPRPVMNYSDCDENRYFASFFLIPTWQNNNYGQISLCSIYDNNSENRGQSRRLEVVHTIHPKPARMVVWPSCVPFIKHPPTVNYYQYLPSFAITFTTKDSKSEDVVRTNNNHPKSFRHFKFTNVDADRAINHEKHLTRSYYDSSNNPIFVYDDLFTHDELKQIKQYGAENGNNHMAQFATAIDEFGDNVGVVSIYNVSDFASCPLWKRVYDLVCHVSGQTGWYPYDVALNKIHTSGHTRIHADAEKHQFEYTYLLYLNPNVGANELGETTWFERVPGRRGDGIHSYTNPGGEEFEAFVAVKPKYGRVVIFRNIIEHSARPLSSQHLGNRYSFAVKVSASKRIALAKQVYETGESLELGDKYSKFFYDLARGKHDDETKSKISTESLEKLIWRFKTMVKDKFKKEIDDISRLI